MVTYMFCSYVVEPTYNTFFQSLGRARGVGQFCADSLLVNRSRYKLNIRRYLLSELLDRLWRRENTLSLCGNAKFGPPM